jgi:biotin carboxylase
VRGVGIDFESPDAAYAALLDETRRHPVAAVIGADDFSSTLAARLARALKLPHNDPAAVLIARRKDLARRALHAGGVVVPAFFRVDLEARLADQADRVPYPCVLKPLALSASRGVIRLDHPRDFEPTCRRIEALLRGAASGDERRYLLAEQFIPGIEVAVEGLLTHGQLDILTVFDKPEPLDGPFFEESYYIAPSRLPTETLARVHTAVQSACIAYGLREGPVHAECRINAEGVWLLEVAARTIGGLCGRLLRFGTGYGLEELVLRHALRRPLDMTLRDDGVGVLMIPVTSGGILRRVEGVLDASKVEYIEDIVIQIREGHELVPWPEGSSYLGFIFARAPSPEHAEAALRKAHACLNVVTAPLWRGIAVDSALLQSPT